MKFVNIDHEDHMMVQEVGEAMKQLSDEHREILIMITVQGMKYDETAERLNIPVGTVRSRLSRARNILMDLMENNDSQGFSISDDVLDNHCMAA